MLSLLEFTVLHPLRSYDVMLYSTAVAILVIFQAVQIEMFFNFVYAPKSADFHFEHVLARPDQPRFRQDFEGKSKSLRMLLKVLGNEQVLKYKGIVLVDDLRNRVWSDYIPRELIDEGVDILALEPTPLEFDGGTTMKYRINLTETEFGRICRIRNRDKTLLQMREVLNAFSPQGIHSWQYAVSSKRIYP